MTVISVEKDLATATMVITAEFEASIDRVWGLWADPRKLERWWGPPTYPATVIDHNMVPGGTVHYSMTGPEGDKHHGMWRVVSVDAPNSFEVEDSFADDAGNPNTELPTTVMRVNLSQQDASKTQAIITATFPNTKGMETLLNMGMEEGMRESMGQMDGVLAA